MLTKGAMLQTDGSHYPLQPPLQEPPFLFLIDGPADGPRICEPICLFTVPL